MSTKSKCNFILSLPALLTVLAWGLLVYYNPSFYNPDAIVEFYQTSLREPLFSGFLTIGAFLFSLKTFIITVMKKEVYDTEEYKRKFLELQDIDKSLKKYDNLKYLGELLFYTVLTSLIVAVSQFTLGFLNFDLASMICTSLAVSGIALLIWGLYEMKKNLDYLFDL